MYKKRMRKAGPLVKIPSPERLANVALFYLSRYAASEQALRRVLQGTIRKAAMRDTGFAQDYEKQRKLHIDIETIIEGHRKTGGLNDAAYAEMKIKSLRRGGKSKKAIEQKLFLKGIDKTVVRQALLADEEENEGFDLDIKGAVMLAKKRRLGPYRSCATSAALHKKDLAIMARAGFSLTLIRKVLGGDVDIF